MSRNSFLRKTRAGRAASLFALAVLGVCAAFAFCLYTGRIQFNSPSRAVFPVRGIDVSHHQGAVDWPELARQDLRFVYIKATEGGDFKDPRFADNWREANKAGFAVGAYHFFLPGRTGLEQAGNFIGSVPRQADALPPALDVECPVEPPGPQREIVRARIAECLARLEAHYGKIPVIYTTYEAYAGYIHGGFARYPLWIRSVFSTPDTAMLGREWLIWQYSSRGRLTGYSGRERFIDLNVFNGKEEAFARFRAGEF
ncbi:MAG: glycoside hydrolase family 25 protein [Deltaproteobacteria bacterium]|nr:glycoside hydrolase family 25 protein [Deltaproteobacteria bacterium]